MCYFSLLQILPRKLSASSLTYWRVASVDWMAKLVWTLAQYELRI